MSTEQIRELREKTGAGMLDCKKALTECDNNLDDAVEFLRKKGIAKAAKKQGRVAGEGIIQSYIHAGGKIGVLLEINCETDFVAKTDVFKELAHEISLQIAAAHPRYVTRDTVPAEVTAKEKEVLMGLAESEGKTGPVVEKITEGRLNKFYQEICLMEQTYIKDPNKSIETLLKEHIGKLGENITIKRFSRFQVGENQA